MAHLALALLGIFQATLDGLPAEGLNSDRLRALLAYLAVESGRAHPREQVASLLWPERPDPEALSALRSALSNLRGALGDRRSPGDLWSPGDRRTPAPFLLITRTSVQFNTGSDHWLDVAEFERLIHEAGGTKQGPVSPGSDSCLLLLESCVALYRGPFLHGLSVAGSPAFHDWMLVKDEEYRRSVLEVLGHLTSLQMARAAYAEATSSSRRQLELEPYREQAHRQLMAALALGGERSAALAHYEACRHLLIQELGCEPEDETQALYAQIRDGGLFQPWPQPQPSQAILPASPGTEAGASFPFVAREQELARLEALLDRALAGEGGVALIASEAGGGKTVLLDEFARRAAQTHGDLIALRGSCNAHGGAGDPYLPFREMLKTLAGDVEGKRAGGTLTPEQARRMWEALPAVGAALVEHGPDLIDTFVPGEPLLRRAEGFPALSQTKGPGPRDSGRWQARLREIVHRAGERATPAPQADLFGQVTQVLHAVSVARPLLLAIDDLQWADSGTAALLFHLGRRLTGSRILLACAYRPEALLEAPDPNGLQRPLGSVLRELTRAWGDVLIDLDEADGRAFVEAYVDSEPNRLGAAFRQALYDHTGGNPLFTVELLGSFERDGTLAQDEAGRWVEAAAPDWERWPPQVEVVIAGHLAGLPDEDRALLQVASVQGEQFAAEVAARVLGWAEDAVVRRLSGPLSSRQRLVQAVSLERLASSGQRLSHYCFRHSLVQGSAYRSLDAVERARLHEATGLVLEALHGAQARGLAVELARHFEAAGLVDKAVDYSLEAGKRAMDVSAHHEAVQHFRRGLVLLSSLPHSPKRDGQEIDLQLALGSALLATEGMGSQAQLVAYSRAYELSNRLGERAALWPALHALASSSTARGQYQQALQLGEQLLALAQRAADPAVLALAHFTLGATLFSQGISLPRAREHLEQAIRYYDFECDSLSRRFLTSLNMFDLGVNSRAWLANVLWILGYPDQALSRSQQALETAQQLDHFLSRVLALYAASHAHQARGEDQALRKSVQALERLVSGKHLLVGEVWVEVFSGWLLVRAGQVEEGLARMRQGSDAWQKTGAVFGTTAQLSLLAEACLLAGKPEEGLEAVDRALALVERTGARPNEAELHRLRGELLLARGDEAQAEQCFGRAIELARAGEQKRWELRAAMSLVRLRERQGDARVAELAEARSSLRDLYARFAEGVASPDLKEAAALIGETG